MTHTEPTFGASCRICIGGPSVQDGLCSCCRGSRDAERHRIVTEVGALARLFPEYHPALEKVLVIVQGKVAIR